MLAIIIMIKKNTMMIMAHLLRLDLDGSAYYIKDQDRRSWGLSAGEPLPGEVKSVAGTYHFLGEPEARGVGTTTTRLVRTPSAAEASTTARLIPAPTERTRQATPPPAGSRGTSANRSAGPSRATRQDWFRQPRKLKNKNYIVSN